ncbi:3-isopropylmalate dehydratase large subunit [bacterium]|nr:3-isopropylmalate dehydratase large subunit [candidate division CSSED10-310 bacterium]
MGATFIQKFLAWKAGLDKVEVGQTVVVEPDIILTHDNTAAIIKTFNSIKPGITLAYPDRHVIILDHCTPAASEMHATNHKVIREFVEQQGIPHFHDIQEGICHQVIAERYAAPGLLIVGSDSHTVTAGAFGTVAVPIDRTEAAGLMATGRTWLMVPPSIKIELTGEFKPHVGAKDLILQLIGDISASGADYRSVEFLGPGATQMSMEERMTVSNMIIEAGGKCAYFAPDRKTRKYMKAFGRRSVKEFLPDRTGNYERHLKYDLGQLAPVVAKPHSVDNVSKVTDLERTKIDQVVIGTCTNGRITDLRAAAAILDGKHVARGVRLLILPASRTVLLEAVQESIIRTMVKAGAVIVNPGCGPCMGNHAGVLAPGEICLSTANRNFKGRMGCKDAFIYLSGPETAAYSALAGYITTMQEDE